MPDFPGRPKRNPFRCIILAASLLMVAHSLGAQQPLSIVDSQREAMQKLAFLVGRWSGPVTIRGAGEPLQLLQTEDVQFKLSGLVLLIQGASRKTDGSTSFEALATVAYDEATKTYRFRAYNAGHYVDAEMNVVADGFSWTYNAGPAHIANTMHLSPKGEWAESTEVTVGTKPAMHSVDMLLVRQR